MLHAGQVEKVLISLVDRMSLTQAIIICPYEYLYDI